MKKPDDLTNNTGTHEAKAERGRRGRRAAEFIYCLEVGNSEGGKLQLGKPNAEEEILLDALKTGVPYYRLQKFTAKVERTSEGLKIVGAPA